MVADQLEVIRTLHFAHHTHLKGFGTDYVPGEGTEEGALAFIVGEAPGAQEAVQHRPFVGKSGLVLRDLMAVCGLYSTPEYDDYNEQRYAGPANAWLTNAMKFRPDGNRTPEWIEMRAVRQLLRQEWTAVGSPKLVIPVGGSALRSIVGRPHVQIIKHAGWLHTTKTKEGDPLYVWPMLHPSFGLRVPAVRNIIEKDWTNLHEWMINAHHPGFSCR